MRLGLAGPYAFVVRESSVGRFCVRYALAFFVPFLFYTMQNRLTYKKRKYKKTRQRQFVQWNRGEIGPIVATVLLTGAINSSNYHLGVVTGGVHGIIETVYGRLATERLNYSEHFKLA
jgi:hypothetical protein